MDVTLAPLAKSPGRLIWLLCLGLPCPVLLGSLLVGPTGSLGAGEALHAIPALFSLAPTPSGAPQELAVEVLSGIRLPRILLAFLTGAALTASGAVLQALVRNPLVSPDILGLSAGAACGAALALSLPWLPLQPTAFAGGLGAAVASYALARTKHGVPMLSLILAGVVISALATAALTVIQVLADPFKLQTIVHWTMGNLHNANWEKVRSAAGPIILGSAVLLVRCWRLNVLSLGDLESRSVGLDPERGKLFFLLPAALVASAAVAVAGIIGMIGLVIPHLVRMLVGPDNRRVIPLCLAVGGSFLVLVDDVSRSATTFELPTGIFTTVLGAPLFVVLLRRLGARFGE